MLSGISTRFLFFVHPSTGHNAHMSGMSCIAHYLWLIVHFSLFVVLIMHHTFFVTCHPTGVVDQPLSTAHETICSLDSTTNFTILAKFGKNWAKSGCLM